MSPGVTQVPLLTRWAEMEKGPRKWKKDWLLFFPGETSRLRSEFLDFHGLHIDHGKTFSCCFCIVPSSALQLPAPADSLGLPRKQQDSESKRRRPDSSDRKRVFFLLTYFSATFIHPLRSRTPGNSGEGREDCEVLAKSMKADNRKSFRVFEYCTTWLFPERTVACVSNEASVTAL